MTRCYFALFLYFRERIGNVAKISATNRWVCPIMLRLHEEGKKRKGKIEKGIRHLGEEQFSLFKFDSLVVAKLSVRCLY